MEDTALTPQLVARIVLQEQDRAPARNARWETIRKTWTERYTPYYKSRLDVAPEAKTVWKNTADSRKERPEPKTPHREEEVDKVNTNALATDHSSISSPATSSSSLHDTITSAASTATTIAPTKELCPTFTSTGTNFHDLLSGLQPNHVPTDTSPGSCVSTCLQTHDRSRMALCQSRIQGQPCFSMPACRKSHTWSFQNAPTCANFLANRYCIRGNRCGYAHNEKVFPLSGLCQQFSKLGFCEAGGDCDQIHWIGFRTSINIGPQSVSETGALRDGRDRLSVARAKVVARSKAQELARNAEKASRQSFTGEMWAKHPEELLGSEIKGQFALQEDFVPF